MVAPKRTKYIHTNVADLRELALARGLPTQGNKIHLIGRLVKQDEEQERDNERVEAVVRAATSSQGQGDGGRVETDSNGSADMLLSKFQTQDPVQPRSNGTTNTPMRALKTEPENSHLVTSSSTANMAKRPTAQNHLPTSAKRHNNADTTHNDNPSHTVQTRYGPITITLPTVLEKPHSNVPVPAPAIRPDRRRFLPAWFGEVDSETVLLLIVCLIINSVFAWWFWGVGLDFGEVSGQMGIKIHLGGWYTCV